MDYEELYQQMQVLEKEIKEKLTIAQKTFNNLAKNSERGELKNLSKYLTQMNGFISGFESLVAQYAHLAEGFDVKAYMENGDFAAQLIKYCEKLSVDIKGDFPTYEIFPYKVKIDSENQELTVNGRKVHCARPMYFAGSIKRRQDKLNKASFNVEAFLNELVGAYDAALKQKEKPGQMSISDPDLHLSKVYNCLVPMQRFRKEYDMQSYAFDLSRLYNSDIETTKDNRSFEFGSSRTAGKLIRILDKDGKEQFISTIRFFTR